MAAVVAILAGPVALAFFQGGFFDLPRLWTAAGAWLLVLLAVLAAPRPLPVSTAGRCALAGLALLTAWTAVSLAWAPLRAPAVDDVQRLVLYLGGLLAACAFLRGERALRAVEPGVAAGTVIAALYGLSERLLPGLFELTRSASAEGRLDQPLTYWNAMGALTAVGLVLCTRLSGDARRPVAIRAASAAAVPVLGLTLFLTLSRGAIAAAAAGLLVLVVLCPTRLQLRAAVLTVVSAALAAGVSLALPAVRTLDAGQSARDGQGLVMLGALVVLAGGAALLQARVPAPTGELSVIRRHARTAAVAAGVVSVAVVIAGAALSSGERKAEPAQPRTNASPGRLSSVQSSRYDYWKVAAQAFADHPVEGLGSSGFRARWLVDRPALDPAKDAHSLYIETPAELGLVGLAALALLIGGVTLSARRALARAPEAAAGLVAALTVWALHAGIDWDWEMPALTLLAVTLSGALIALGDE